jgi:hypothetical protein
MRSTRTTSSKKKLKKKLKEKPRKLKNKENQQALNLPALKELLFTLKSRRPQQLNSLEMKKRMTNSLRTNWITLLLSLRNTRRT